MLSVILFLLGLVSLLLIVIVLMQDSKAGGLSTAFGGGGGESLLGASGQTELAKFTVWLVLGFFLLSIASGIWGNQETLLDDDAPPAIESTDGGEAGTETTGGEGAGTGTETGNTSEGDG